MLRKNTKAALSRYKTILESALKRQLNKPDSDLSKSIRAKRFSNAKVDRLNIFMNEYGLNVNYGRRPGRFPPPQKIRDWAKKYLGLQDAKLKRATYLISKKIAERGIEPTRFIDIVIDKFEPRITKDLASAYLKDIEQDIDKSTPTAKKG